MITKTYQGETMMEVLHLIQDELGPDAIVVSAREVVIEGGAGDRRKKKGVEVVAMRESELPEMQGARKEKTPVVLRQSPDGKGVEFIEERPPIEWAAELTPAKPAQPDKKPQWSPRYLSRREIQAEKAAPHSPAQTEPAPEREANPPKAAPQSAALTHPTSAEEPTSRSLPANIPESLLKIRQQMLSQEVDPSFVEKLVSLTVASYAPSVLQDPSLCRKHFSELLQAEISIQPAATLFGSKPVVCLVGASGVGKTTLAARLAIFYHSQLGKQVTWVCTDTIHTGAISEAKAYTDAIGVPLRLVYTPSDLGQVLDKAKGNDLVIVDTPGYNPLEEAQLVELGTFLTEIPVRSTLLTISAGTKESDLAQAAAALKLFHIDGLAVTKLDETRSFGNVFNFSRKNQLPLTYFTFGKSASGSLQAADASRLASALLGKGWI